MTNLHKNNSGSIVAVVAILVAITLVGVAGYIVFNKNKNSNASMTKTSTQDQQQQNDASTSTEQAPQSANEDDQVTAAFYSHCSTNPVPEGYVKDYVIGTMTSEQKKFVYSADKNFVALNGRCGVKKIDSSESTGGGMAYIFKKTNGSWSFITGAQQRISDEVVAKYGIPADFLKAIGLD